MTKITGTNTYIDVELDGRTARIAGEMIVGGFVLAVLSVIKVQ